MVNSGTIISGGTNAINYNDINDNEYHNKYYHNKHDNDKYDNNVYNNVYHHDNHHLASTPTGGPAFVAHASGYHNDHNHYGRPNLDFLNNDLYYDNNDDPPAHNDDDYLYHTAPDDNGFNDYDEYDDPADYEHLTYYYDS
jgi:hypothetical protein